MRGKEHRVENAMLADNAVGATFASTETYLVDSFVVGESANGGAPKPYEKKGPGGRALPKPWQEDFPIRGFEFYDGLVGVERTTFANFTPSPQRQASGLGYLLDNAFPLDPANYAKDVRFVDANRVFLRNPTPGKNGDFSSVFRDADGSVTGEAGRIVAANVPFLLDGSCARREEWNAHVCATGHVSVRVSSDGGAGLTPLVLRRPDGTEQTLQPPKEGQDSVSSTVLGNGSYEVVFSGGVPGRSRYVLSGGGVVEFTLALPRAPRVTKYGCEVDDPKKWCYGGRPGSVAELAGSKSSTYFYDAANQRLHLRIVGNKDYEELQVAL